MTLQKEVYMRSVKEIQRTYYLVISLFWLATALPISLLVLFAQARGLNLFQVGIVMGLYSIDNRIAGGTYRRISRYDR